jgi:hypothetical protein
MGQETQKDLEPPYITFGDKSIDYMEGELNKLIAANKQKQSFLGIAIHYYASYKELLKNENK